MLESSLPSVVYGNNTFTFHPAVFMWAQFILMALVLGVGAIYVYLINPHYIEKNMIYAVFGFNNLCVFIDSPPLLPFTTVGYVLWFVPSCSYLVLKYLTIDPEWLPHMFYCLVIGLAGQIIFVWPFAAKPVLENTSLAMWTSFFHVTGYGVQVLCGCISILGVALITEKKADWSKRMSCFFKCAVLTSFTLQAVGVFIILGGSYRIYTSWEDIATNPGTNDCGDNYLCTLQLHAVLFTSCWLFNPLFAIVVDHIVGPMTMRLHIGYKGVSTAGAPAPA